MNLENRPVGEAEMSPVRRALLEMRDKRARLAALGRARTDPIAIVDLGCRFPGGANDPESLWRLLLARSSSRKL